MRLVSFSIISLFILLISCSSEDDKIDYNPVYSSPIAAFSYTGNEGPAPVTVHFTNHSETFNPDSATYLWTFGEHGPQSTDKDPVQTFYNNTSTAESVLIKLTVNDLMTEKSQTKSLVIMIQPAE